MKARAKLISTIVAMCLVITLGVFGILAVKTLNMSVGGNITFSADGLALEVSAGEFKTTENGDYSNITTQNNKMQAFAIDTNTKQGEIQDKIDSWSGLELQLDSKGDAVLHFNVTNKMTTPLFVYISTTLGTSTNDNMSLNVSPNNIQINAGEISAFSITFDILDMNINAGLQGFNVVVELKKESLVQVQNKIDQATGLPTAQVDYYYVEMGTYNGEPLRWRYVADSNCTRYDGITHITVLSGYYVLETKLTTSKAFLAGKKMTKNQSDNQYYHVTEGYTNIYANDYGISDIRAYLTNTGSGGFMEALGISNDNIIYQMIKARSITDLYSGINGYEGTEIDSANANFSLSLMGEYDISGQSDKFWLMSYKEISIFFADQTSRVWSSGVEKSYWLRSPELSVTCNAGYVNAIGEIYNSIIYGTIGIRPAFKI